MINPDMLLSHDGSFALKTRTSQSQLRPCFSMTPVVDSMSWGVQFDDFSTSIPVSRYVVVQKIKNSKNLPTDAICNCWNWWWPPLSNVLVRIWCCLSWFSSLSSEWAWISSWRSDVASCSTCKPAAAWNFLKLALISWFFVPVVFWGSC